MNLGQLWAGNDYAYYSSKGRGEVFRSNAKRVRIIKTYKKQLYDNVRESGFAQVFMCTDDGDLIERNGEPYVTDVRARDIAMHWDAYADERDHRQVEFEKQERLRKIEREKRDREYNERIERQRIEREAAALKAQELRQKVMDHLYARHDIPKHWIDSVSATTVVLSRAAIERELNGDG